MSAFALQFATTVGARVIATSSSDDKLGRLREQGAIYGVDHIIKVGGHISLIGVPTGVSGEAPIAALMAKQARPQGLIVGSRAEQADMVRAIEATGMKPVIDRSFPPDRLADAFRYEETGGHLGKIVVEI